MFGQQASPVSAGNASLPTKQNLPAAAFNALTLLCAPPQWTPYPLQQHNFEHIPTAITQCTTNRARMNNCSAALNFTKKMCLLQAGRAWSASVTRYKRTPPDQAQPACSSALCDTILHNIKTASLPPAMNPFLPQCTGSLAAKLSKSAYQLQPCPPCC